MRKKIITILIGLAVLLALGAGLLISKLFIVPTDSGDKTEPPGVEENYGRDGYVIYSLRPALLEYMTVENSHGAFDVRQKNGKIVIDGAEDLLLLSETVSNLYSCAEKVIAETVIERGVEDLSVYGLTAPLAKLTLHKVTESADTLLVGNKTPDGKAYYLCVDGENDVYAVSTYFAERLMKSPADLVSGKIYKIFSVPDLQNFTVDRENESIYARKCTQEELDLKIYESSMILDKPFAYGANTDYIQACAEKLIGLTAEVIAVSPDEQMLKKYGFGGAEISVTVGFEVDTSLEAIDNVANDYYDPDAKKGTYISLTSTYLVGKTVGNVTYVMYDGYDTVYAVDSARFDFATKSIDNFCQRLVMIRYLNELKSFTVAAPDESYKIDVWTQTEGEKTSYFASYNGKRLEGSYMQELYKMIVGVSNYGYVETVPDGDRMLTVTLEGMDGCDTIVEFIPVDKDELYAYCLVNGDGHFIVKTSQLDRIITNVRKLINGEKVEYIYQ